MLLANVAVLYPSENDQHLRCAYLLWEYSKALGQ